MSANLSNAIMTGVFPQNLILEAVILTLKSKPSEPLKKIDPLTRIISMPQKG
jgi:hypothetical protein